MQIILLTILRFFICSFLTAVSSIGEPVNHSISLAMTSWENRLFLSGGFNGVMLGRLIALSVPSDPCVLLLTPEACNNSTGSCVWCRGTCTSSDTAERYSLRIREVENFEWILNKFNKSLWESKPSVNIIYVVTVFFYFNCYLTSFFRIGCPVGHSPCFPTPRVPDQCRRLKTCSECLARHPKTSSSPGQVTEMWLTAVL